ncbi:MAG: hypothetical protein Q7S10_00425 [bacterium]|nr:hypothetical protein [bacterium]
MATIKEIIAKAEKLVPCEDRAGCHFLIPPVRLVARLPDDPFLEGKAIPDGTTVYATKIIESNQFKNHIALKGHNQNGCWPAQYFDLE